MNIKEYTRVIAIEFAYWLENNTFKDFHGYSFILSLEEGMDGNEYQLDELYDYWIENIYLKEDEQG